LEPLLCVVSSWVKKKFILYLFEISLVDPLTLTIVLSLKSISHKILINSLFYWIYILFVIYIVHLLVVRLRSCRVIYYFDIPALGIKHQSFDHVTHDSTPKCSRKGALKEQMVMCLKLRPTKDTHLRGNDLKSMQFVYIEKMTYRNKPKDKWMA
jgi:hypothetical protein